MIGNVADAALALTRPREFVLSAEGTTRMVYLINGVVYKVEYCYGVNELEYDNILNSVSLLPDNVKYPEATLYSIEGETIIAMEYISGTAIYECFCEDYGDDHADVCMTHSERALLVDIMSDPNGMNVIRTDTVYYIVDAA